MTDKIVILDRDGVINFESENYIRTPDAWKPIPGSLEAIARLNAAGFIVAVATNQSGVGREYYSLETLDAIHDKMQSALAEVNGHIDGIFFCPHTPDDDCECRKPLPGLLKQIADHFQIDLHGVPVIGDSLRDLISADTVGARAILVRTGNGKQTELDNPQLEHITVFDDLAEAVSHIV